MADTVFTNNVTLTDADWFNDVNVLTYDLCGDGTNEPTTKAQVRQNLGIDNLTEDTAPVAASDYVETYDASATTSKKVLLGRIANPTLGTAQASTSGTSIDFTGIPSWVKKIIVSFSGVSTNGTSIPQIQIGDSGGVETSGYLGVAANNGTAGNFTSGFVLRSSHAATSIFHGSVIIVLLDSATNTWTANGNLGLSDSSGNSTSAYSKALSATLDRVRITTVNGTDTFDAGLINIMYE